ncbi:phosphotransferase [Solihabitans fulvus]|uniref:Phosphotransferase n=1 Tax=Solihabitans fulvus TaxID=1892852 RepID=A0A5B2WPF8_9PSEU|nr:aminoglycoside phosphotransferase family protein [Solihabitans fulvus]KAA2253335.1 phosphotransferase [Solihabitans fulvus]
MTPLVEGLPDGAIERLTNHYGAGVGAWLSRAARIVGEVAARWNVTVVGFHDAGWTSVVGVGHTRAGHAVMIKAMPDAERFRQEKEALGHWAGAGVCRLIDADDTAQVLLVEAVADVAGGAARPHDHARRVAEAIPSLHTNPALPGRAVPLLTEYYRHSVMPRIERRARQYGSVVGAGRISSVRALCRDLCSASLSSFMLHSDLYAENVLFDQAQRAVFIDPHAKIGSPAFDWAFWCVYYTPTSGFAERVALCHEHVPDQVDEVLAWSATLAVDGALYYLDTADYTATSMLQILDSPLLSPVLGSRR